MITNEKKVVNWKQHCSTVTSKCRNFLRSSSLGQYNTKLYFNGQDTYSSSLGGLLSLVLGIFLVSLVLGSMISCLNREEWEYKEEQILMQDWEHKDKSLGAIMNLGLTLPSITLSNPSNLYRF